jgi:hypothetical protein
MRRAASARGTHHEPVSLRAEPEQVQPTWSEWTTVVGAGPRACLGGA